MPIYTIRQLIFELMTKYPDRLHITATLVLSGVYSRFYHDAADVQQHFHGRNTAYEAFGIINRSTEKEYFAHVFQFALSCAGLAAVARRPCTVPFPLFGSMRVENWTSFECFA